MKFQLRLRPHLDTRLSLWFGFLRICVIAGLFAAQNALATGKVVLEDQYVGYAWHVWCGSQKLVVQSHPDQPMRVVDIASGEVERIGEPYSEPEWQKKRYVPLACSPDGAWLVYYIWEFFERDSVQDASRPSSIQHLRARHLPSQKDIALFDAAPYLLSSGVVFSPDGTRLFISRPRQPIAREKELPWRFLWLEEEFFRGIEKYGPPDIIWRHDGQGVALLGHAYNQTIYLFTVSKEQNALGKPAVIATTNAATSPKFIFDDVGRFYTMEAIRDTEGQMLGEYLRRCDPRRSATLNPPPIRPTCETLATHYKGKGEEPPDRIRKLLIAEDETVIYDGNWSGMDKRCLYRFRIATGTHECLVKLSIGGQLSPDRRWLAVQQEIAFDPARYPKHRENVGEGDEKISAKAAGFFSLRVISTDNKLPEPRQSP